jgi:hypothetical protein
MGTFYDTIMKPALEAIGLPATRPAQPGTRTQPARPAVRGVRLHDLRHTMATMQLMAGTHFMQVSRLLGHGTYTLTLDTYGDWIPEEDGRALNDLPELGASQPVSTPEFGERSTAVWSVTYLITSSSESGTACIPSSRKSTTQ